MTGREKKMAYHIFRMCFFAVLVSASASCFAQESEVEKASFEFRFSDDLEKGLKNPTTTKGLYIRNYEDSVFPSEDIIKLVNVEQIVVIGKDRLRDKKNDVAGQPMRVRIDLERLQKLSKLKYLGLSYFDFRVFPVELCRLKNLELLDISSCFLDSLPEEIGNLTNLKMLVSRKNNLASLPASIAQLDSLKFLDLANNRFTKIPAELLAMKSLHKVSLANPETTVELPERDWKWPYPVHVNKIDYLAEYAALQSLVSKSQVMKVYVTADSPDVARQVNKQLNSLELYRKITWQYFPAKKGGKR